EKGKKEGLSPNNVGTYYACQIASYALFTDQIDLAREIVNVYGKRMVNVQIDDEGKMNSELKRATAWEYVKFNLIAFDYLVEIGDVLGIDLYNYQNAKGGSVKKVHEWLSQFADGRNKWSYGKGPSSVQVSKILQRSSISSFKKPFKNNRYNLTYINLL